MINHECLPIGWIRARLGRLFDIEYGKGLPKASRERSGSVPVYGSSGFVGNHSRALVDGPVVIIGRKGNAGNVFYTSAACWPIDTTYYISDFCGVDPVFLCDQLTFLNLAEHDSSTTIPSLLRDDLFQVEIVIPPVNEQRRIVRKIEELFSKLDAGVAALERVKANLKRYRAAVLKSAVEGKLTAEWRAKHPDTEPASKLLERILKERRQKWEQAQLAKYAAASKAPPKGWREKYQEPPGPGIRNPSIPKGWCWVALAQLATFQNGRAFPSKGYTDEGVKLLRPGNLFADGSVRWTSGNTQRMPMVWAERHPDYCVAGGELIMNLTAQSLKDEFLGRTCLTPPDEECLLNQRLARITPIEGFSARFALILLKSRTFRMFVSGLNTGSLIQHMFTSQLIGFSFALPPAAEQGQVVAEVERRLSIVNELEVQVEADLKRAGRLRQSILKRAFAGRLVAQDPADEPATELLARIRAERLKGQVAAAESKGKQPKRKEPKGIIFRRAAVVSYVVKALGDKPAFGRTQLEKVLFLAQAHLKVDLALEFKRHAAGPFDEAIYKLEAIARKRDWFTTRDRPNYGVTYHPGAALEERCQAAVAILGDKRTALDRLFGQVAKMDTERAELLATTYAAWNDLLLDGRPATDEAIIQEVHAWHPKKERFAEDRIKKCLAWMRQQGYVPEGTGQKTQALHEKTRQPRRTRRAPKSHASPRPSPQY